MKNLQKFIKTSGIYLLGNVLTKAIAFIMLPIYTKYLSPTDYGTYDVNIAYITFLSSVLFLDIWSSVMRFMFDYKSIDAKQKPILSGFVIFFISTVVYTVFSFFLGNLMSVDYIFWVFLYGLTMNLQQFFAYIVRGLGKNALFAMAGLIGSIVSILANIFFIAVLKKGYEYLYISSVLGSVVNIVILMMGSSLKTIFRKKNYDKALTSSLFIFSLPLTVNSVSWWFLTAFNRVMISSRLSVAENGLYSVASKFTSVMQLVDQAFQMAWQEMSFSKGGSNNKDKPVFFSNAINEYIKFMTMGVALLLPVIKIVFPYFINRTFNEALNLIPLALIATLFSSISSFLGSTLTAIKQNKYLFTTTVTGTVINVLVISLTINILHVQAANIALGLGFLIVDIRRYVLLGKYIELSFDKKGTLPMMIMVIVATITFFCGGLFLNMGIFLIFIPIIIFIYRKTIRKILFNTNL